MNKNQIKKEFQENFLELRKILNSCELIPDSPPDEFDSINYQLLSHLYKDASFDKVSHIIYNELITYYGLSTKMEETKRIAKEIIKWWNLKNN